MSEFTSNLLLALESGDDAIRRSAIRTIEEIMPHLQSKADLSELRETLLKVVKEKKGEVKQSAEQIVELLDAYAA